MFKGSDMRMTSPPRLPGLVVGREFVAYCALDRLVLIIHPLPRRLQLWEVLDAALDGDHAGILLDCLDLRRAMRWRHDGDMSWRSSAAFAGRRERPGARSEAAVSLSTFR